MSTLCRVVVDAHVQVLGLTAYAFHATKRGVDFSFMGELRAAVGSHS